MKRLLYTLLSVSGLLNCGATSLATDSPPALRLAAPGVAFDSYNAAEAVALNERYALLCSPQSSVKKPGTAQILGQAGEVFVFNATTGSFVKRLISPGLQANEEFGSAVAVSGNTAYITSTLNTDGGADSGIVYAIDVPSGRLLWKRSGAVGQELGESIAVDGDSLIVGCSGEVGNFPNGSGSVVHLSRHTGALIATYSPPLNQTYLEFGSAVAVSGNIAVCGAPGAEIAGKVRRGLVAVIDLVSHQVNTISPADGESQDSFGHSVAIAGGRILVGAYQAQVNGMAQIGAAYLYDASSLQIIQKILPPPTLNQDDRFGDCVAMSGNLAVITASSDGVRNGSAWLLDLNGMQLTECAQRPASQSAALGESLAMSQNAVLIGDPGYNQANDLPDGAAYFIRNLRQSLGSTIAVARSQEAAPGIPSGAVFTNFQEAVISGADKFVFSASVSGQGVTPANSRGVWDTIDSGNLTMSLRSGEALGATKLASFGKLFVGQNGCGHVNARMSNGKATGFTLWNGGSWAAFTEGAPFFFSDQMQSFSATLSRVRDYVGSFNVGGIEGVACLNIASGKDLVAASADSMICYKQPSAVVAVREGKPSPLAGAAYGQLLPRTGVAEAKFVFAGALQGPSSNMNQAVFTQTYNMNNAALVAQKGSNAPGTSGAKFSGFLGEGIAKGKVVLRATLSGGSPGQSEGLWSDRDMVLKNVALRGQQAPGLPAGVKFGRFSKYFMTNALEVVFETKLEGAGVTPANDSSIWLSSFTGVLNLLAREGSGAPGCQGAKYGSFQRLDVDAEGNYVVLASLSGAPPSCNQALFLGNVSTGSIARRMPMLALRKGSFVDRNGAEQLKSISINALITDVSGSGTKGIGKTINANGAIFCLEFADGSKELTFGKP